jgi:hypothetical protein
MVMLMIEHNFECTLDDAAVGASASRQLTSVGVESTRASWGTGELRHVFLVVTLWYSTI